MLLGQAADRVALAHSDELRVAGAGVEQLTRNNGSWGRGRTGETSGQTADSTAYLTFTRNESTLVHKYYLCQNTHTLTAHSPLD